MLQLSENSINFKKRQANQKSHERPQGHRILLLPKYMGRTKETIQQEKPMQNSHSREKLKDLWIKNLRVEIDFSIDKMVSCYIPMATLGAGVEKFKVGDTANCYTRPVCFKYSKI